MLQKEQLFKRQCSKLLLWQLEVQALQPELCDMRLNTDVHVMHSLM